MNKEEFAKKMAEAQSRLDRAKSDMRKLKKEYIDSLPFKVGDKVRVDTPADKFGLLVEEPKTEYGYIYRLSVSDEGVFTPDLHACKKDGTEHKTKNLWVSYYMNPTITKVEE